MPLLAPVQGEDAIGVSPNEVHRKLCCIDESEMLFLLFRIALGGIMERNAEGETTRTSDSFVSQSNEWSIVCVFHCSCVIAVVGRSAHELCH